MPNVLLVEDRDDVREVIRESIESAGYTLEWAASWAEGWRKLAQSKHDVVVADVRLPDGSGRDLARRAVGLGKKAVLITGHPNEVRRTRPEIIYLRKPFLMRTLMKAIEQHIGPPPEPVAVPDLVTLAAAAPITPPADASDTVPMIEAGPIFLGAGADPLAANEIDPAPIYPAVGSRLLQ